MELILRILASPFLLACILVLFIYRAFERTYLFIRHGGEWINYSPEDRRKIEDIYNFLKEQQKT